ncbi:hypothetical protein QEH59_00585 [Coraliomargarita sp. SDUM461004]|uniref:Family 43 glycosylhydrolase n=1 Tax=Thalassobacterium sedimentorum TaxID=3041258 RepID=A0ABU1AE01_9BACT|nr:hypothetical protein [Coraliomargarita sp. SDUM461004]MDQ8192900.1 hypothetical protein [Coraliomargarita sp. SDUM461004]
MKIVLSHWRHSIAQAFGLATLLLCALLVLPLSLHSEDSEMLMQRDSPKPVLGIKGAPHWRSVHVANAAILRPEESPDSLWRMYVRGSAFYPNHGGAPEDYYHDSIGLLYQTAVDFSPRGPWLEHPDNPLLIHGERDAHDGKHLLDCAPVWGQDAQGEDTLYLIYKAISYGGGGSLAAAFSPMPGDDFTKFLSNPLQSRVGPCDVVYHEGKYYIYYGNTKYDVVSRRNQSKLKTYLAVVDDIRDFPDAERSLVLDVGQDGAFDSESVHGGRIFQLKDRWYMVYQCSDRHMDYPNRFHVAWSDDLLSWNKVDNPHPFFLRGPAGTWDEGGIWYGEVFEYEGTLYMYYEGWGTGKPRYDRDRPYVRGARSQTGLASVSVDDFLKWCGH